MKEKAYTVVYMVLVAAVLTAGVAAVQMATQERANLNRELARKRVIMKVLGIGLPQQASLRELSDVYAERVRDTGLYYEDEQGRHPVLAGLGPDGSMTGYAFEISGRGFWDVIRGFMAVSPDLNEILGVSFYQQSETAGLGGEIAKPWFEEQFKGKPIAADAASRDTTVRLLPPGSEHSPGDVDAITGATQTSLAVESFLNEDLHSFLGVMERRARDEPDEPRR